MTLHSLAIRDITMSVTELGDGDPLLLLHGGLATAEMSWTSRYPALAAEFRVIAPDTRGHGRSTNPSDRLAYDQFADDIVALCGALGVERPLVVGFSDGGQTALELALRHPSFARAIVLCGTVSHKTPAYLAGMREGGFVTPGEADPERFAALLGDYIDTLRQAHPGNDEPDYWPSLLRQISHLWLTLPDYTPDQLATIATPTLVVTGDHDEVATPDQAQRLYDTIPDAELTILPDTDHAATDTDLFWSIALAFLRRHR